MKGQYWKPEEQEGGITSLLYAYFPLVLSATVVKLL